MAWSPQHRPSLLRGPDCSHSNGIGSRRCIAQVVIKRKAVPVRPLAAGSVKAKARGGETAADDAGENVFLRPERSTLKKLSKSRKLLAEGRFAEAVRNLDAILEGPEDFFIEQDKNSGKSRGLKAEAQR